MIRPELSFVQVDLIIHLLKGHIERWNLDETPDDPEAKLVIALIEYLRECIKHGFRSAV